MVGNPSVDRDAYVWVVDTKGVGVLPPVDTTAPTATAPRADLGSGSPTGTTSTPCGCAGRARTAPVAGSATSSTGWLSSGRAYRYRVRAVDWAGNASTWATGPTVRATMRQETAWTYSSGWSRVACSSASDAYVRRTATKGATARISFYGGGFAVYGLRTPGHGKSAVHLDGVHVGTVSQYATSASYRVPLLVRSGLSTSRQHTLVVKSLESTGAAGGGTAVSVDVVTTLR